MHKRGLRMLSSPEDQDTHPLPSVKRMDAPQPSPTRQLHQFEPMGGQPSPTTQFHLIPYHPGRTTDALPDQDSNGQMAGKRSSTGQLPDSLTLITRKLPESAALPAVTRRLTHIPASQKKRPFPSAPPVSHGRRTARLFTVIICT